MGSKTCISLAKLYLGWLICAEQGPAVRCTTSNTWAGDLVPFPKLLWHRPQISAAKGTNGKFWIFFWREWSTPLRAKDLKFEHWGDVVAFWVLGWLSIDQKYYSTRMLHNFINISLTIRYYDKILREKSHEHILYSMWDLNVCSYQYGKTQAWEG